MFEVGDEAPFFELLSDQQKPVKLTDFRGRRVLIFFYPKADTPGCTTQACGLGDNFPRFQENGMAVLGISPDKPEALDKWQKKVKLPYPLLSDPDHAVAEAYGTWGEKSLYGRSYMGIVRSHFIIGPDGRFEEVNYKISPKKSIERALAAL